MLPATVFAEKMAVDTPTVKQILKGDDTEEVQPRETVPYDRLNRSTPRSSVVSLIEAIKNNEHEILLEFLDMRYVPKNIAVQGPELVHKLKIVAKRVFWIGPENLSIELAGHLDDGLPCYRDRVARARGQVFIFAFRYV
ncbi:hypothetical protein bplSymb_SCF00704P004 [Bathymodiolus platifrons methanotrophic gill symbiont]|uniref:hypothetical protein n=1 Tax=Bathymodiolus platifrons methanotrophic gill symbiont TaxID=113268 RepID=UPI000B6E8C48|nr:hypothetical protein [Bathymodiolus platifrons methanotrophic gill symbiont]GAW85436.1 hypothetical protein bplSymb_SCF00704P004 [Bathymodiolus platifrons methanotrophic gill symbiont]